MNADDADRRRVAFRFAKGRLFAKDDTHPRLSVFIRGCFLLRPPAIDGERYVPAEIRQQQCPEAVGNLDEILFLDVERSGAEAAEVAVFAGV